MPIYADKSRMLEWVAHNNAIFDIRWIKVLSSFLNTISNNTCNKFINMEPLFKPETVIFEEIV